MVLFSPRRDEHVDGRSARAKNSMWGSVCQTHGQQNVQCHIHGEGERRLHTDSQVGRRDGARKSFPCHGALNKLVGPASLWKDSIVSPGRNGTHRQCHVPDLLMINSLAAFTSNQDLSFDIGMIVCQLSSVCAYTLYPKWL